MSPRETPSWTKDAAENVRGFLGSELGQAILVQMASKRPRLLTVNDTADVNAVALRAAEVAGFEKAYNAIINLAEAPQETEPGHADAYPSLDDDSRWEDGNNLKEKSTP